MLPSNTLTVYNNFYLRDFLSWTWFLCILYLVMFFSATDLFSFPVNSWKLSVSKTPSVREFHTFITHIVNPCSYLCMTNHLLLLFVLNLAPAFEFLHFAMKWVFPFASNRIEKGKKEFHLNYSPLGLFLIVFFLVFWVFFLPTCHSPTYQGHLNFNPVLEHTLQSRTALCHP